MTGSTPSLRDVEAAMMADLCRARQDDLPLSNQARRGPTFAPTKRNGTDHIPDSQKSALKSAWGNPIKDEESEQIQGLSLKDCPWRPQRGATGFQKLIHNNRPPPLRPSGLRDNTTGLKLVHRPSTIPSSPRPVVDKMPTKEMARLTVKDSPGTKRPSPTVSKVITAKKTRPSPPVTPTPKQQSSDQAMPVSLKDCAITFESIDPSTEQKVFFPCRGNCMVYRTPDLSEHFVAKFVMQLNIADGEQQDAGFLHLAAPGCEPRTHNILSLRKPVASDNCRICFLRSIDEAEPYVYRLEFKDHQTTREFAETIISLQQALEDPDPKESTALVVSPSSDDHPLMGNLVDVSPVPSIDTSSILKSITVEAVDAIYQMANQMSTLIDVQQLDPQSAPFDAISKQMKHNWFERVRGSERAGLEQMVRDLVQTLFCLNHGLSKTLGSDGSTNDEYASVPESLREFLKPIKYTAGELMDLKGLALDCSNNFKNTKFLPKRELEQVSSIAQRIASSPGRLMLQNGHVERGVASPPQAESTAIDLRSPDDRTTQEASWPVAPAHNVPAANVFQFVNGGAPQASFTFSNEPHITNGASEPVQNHAVMQPSTGVQTPSNEVNSVGLPAFANSGSAPLPTVPVVPIVNHQNVPDPPNGNAENPVPRREFRGLRYSMYAS